MKKIFLIFMIGILFSGSNSSAMTLDKDTIKKIKALTFEVVIKKEDKNSLSYEKPLPFDRLPYIIRFDKYVSIGTSFAISENRFVSAAHVMNLEVRSQIKEVFLRDKNGNVFEIDKVFKYSTHRDFIVFSLKNKTVKMTPWINPDPQIDEEVYAVGNALGQGIVIRNGLYTSDTPEDWNGEWKWIRFSAAASPGNSGGPLLDKNGKVIGVVLKKSSNENLNYALPIREIILAKENTGILKMKFSYTLDNMIDISKMGFINETILLPMSFKKLNVTLTEIFEKNYKKILKDLLVENKENIFPKGKGADKLLYNNYHKKYPNLIAKGKDGIWNVLFPNNIVSADLGKNGFLQYGILGHFAYCLIEKPDNIPLKKFYDDSRLFLDLVLKGMPISRPVGVEKIKIVSMGKAQEDYIYLDSFKRKWQVRTWNMEFSDSKVVTMSLPVPNGYAFLMSLDQTGTIDNLITDLKVLSDYINMSYFGTFKQWKEFLGIEKLHPEIFNDFKIIFEYDKQFNYNSSRFAFSYTSDLINIKDNSILHVIFSFFPENEKLKWDVTGINIGEDKIYTDYVQIFREMKPPLTVNEKYRDKWETIANRRFPYNNTSSFIAPKTKIGRVYSGLIPKDKLDTASLLYSVLFAKEGKFDQSDIEEELNTLMQSIKVYEKIK